MNRLSFTVSRGVRSISFAALACASMAFTLPGCPDVESMNTKIADLEKKSTEQQKQSREMAEQVRILTDEHNTMKQLVSQVSTTVLEQKEAVEKIDASVRESLSRRSAPAAAASKARKPAPAAKRRR